MNLAPKEYLRSRRKEITAQIQALSEELKDLDRMESALTGQPLLGFISTEPTIHREEIVSQPRRRRFEGGIKGMILYVLAVAGDAIPALTILFAIKKIFGVEIERTSLSPQLTRLKNGGMVVLGDDGWYITPKGIECFKDLDLKPQTPGRE